MLLSFLETSLRFRNFLLFIAHFSMLLPTHYMCRGWSASAHWLRTIVIGGLLCMQSLQSLHAESVSGTLEIRWVHLHPTSQALRCDYCKHVHHDGDAQTIYRAALTQSVPDRRISRRICVCLFFEICVLVSTWSVLFWKVTGCYNVVSACDFLSARC